MKIERFFDESTGQWGYRQRMDDGSWRILDPSMVEEDQSGDGYSLKYGVSTKPGGSLVTHDGGQYFQAPAEWGTATGGGTAERFGVEQRAIIEDDMRRIGLDPSQHIFQDEQGNWLIDQVAVTQSSAYKQGDTWLDKWAFPLATAGFGAVALGPSLAAGASTAGTGTAASAAPATTAAASEVIPGVAGFGTTASQGASIIPGIAGFNPAIPTAAAAGGATAGAAAPGLFATDPGVGTVTGGEILPGVEGFGPTASQGAEIIPGTAGFNAAMPAAAPVVGPGAGITLPPLGSDLLKGGALVAADALTTPKPFDPTPDLFNSEADRQAAIRAASGEVDAAFGGFNDDYYGGLRQSYLDFQMPRFLEEAELARHNLPLQFSTTGGSAYANTAGDLERDILRSESDIRAQAEDVVNRRRQDVERERSGLLSQVELGAGLGGVADQARSTARALTDPPAFSPIADLFTKYTTDLGNRKLAREFGFGVGPFVQRPLSFSSGSRGRSGAASYVG